MITSTTTEVNNGERKVESMEYVNDSPAVAEKGETDQEKEDLIEIK